MPIGRLVHLRRAIGTFVEDTLAENLLLGDYRPGDTIHATREEGKEHLTFRAERATAPISDAAPSETAPSA